VSRIRRLIDIAQQDIRNVLSKHQNPLIAYSGGKDAMVAAHLVSLIKNNVTAVCEISFYFEKQTLDIKRIANCLNFDVHYKNSLSDEWLLKNRHIIFSDLTKVRAWTFACRQQATVKRFCISNRNDLCIFGRRTQENSVKSKYYLTKTGAQFHPLRDWTTEDVWEYFALKSLPIPFIYTTEFGKIEGNAPFYTLSQSQTRNVNDCWNIINKIDLQMNFQKKFRHG
jgi:3'-phosphoadenosine 5'-phosphosulfate sulfotransferase (PAPS reductase)/FAD synthetase